MAEEEHMADSKQLIATETICRYFNSQIDIQILTPNIETARLEKPQVLCINFQNKW
jgi:hypothetical protein